MKARVGINEYDIDRTHYNNQQQGFDYIVLLSKNRLCINLQDIKFIDTNEEIMNIRLERYFTYLRLMTCQVEDQQ